MFNVYAFHYWFTLILAFIVAAKGEYERGAILISAMYMIITPALLIVSRFL